MATNILPHNLEAEQSVLGCILIDAKLQGEIIPCLDPDDFYVESNKTIFNAIQTIAAESKTIDLVTLTDALERNAKLSACGGIAYLSDLARVIPSTANWKGYVDIVTRDGTLRRLIRGSNKIIEDAKSSENSVKSLALAEKIIYDISEKTDRGNLTPISDSFCTVMENLDSAARGKDVFTGLKTGYRELDKMTNGFKKGNLIILAARPSCGKSTLAMNIIENIAIGTDKVCAMFALEMTKDELAMRSLCSVSGVSQRDAISGNIGNRWDEVAKASKKISNANIFIDDTAMTTTAEILSKCRRLKSKVGLDLIVIDHIQLMEVPKDSKRKNEGKQQEVTEISRNLKMIAKELEVPVLALSQMSRAISQRKGGQQRPQLTDLRESGAIEQDADIVIFIHRPDKFAGDDEIKSGKVMKDSAEIIVDKNRNGAIGSFDLKFSGDTSRFEEYEQKGGSDDFPSEPRNNNTFKRKEINNPKEEDFAPFDAPVPDDFDGGDNSEDVF